MKADIDWFQQNANVSRETLERLQIYADLLEKWNRKINLVAPNTLETMWNRHFLDSTQLFEHAPKSGRWIDLGSGGGFPGAVVGIMAAENPDLDVTLIESDQRKCAFLRNVSRETNAGYQVIASRIEAAPPQNASILSARALASLSQLLGFAEIHLAPGGQALFPKGKRADQEINEALEHWAFDVKKHPSKTDPDAVILKIGDIQRA